MKKNLNLFKKVSLLSVTALTAVALTACGNDEGSNGDDPDVPGVLPPTPEVQDDYYSYENNIGPTTGKVDYTYFGYDQRAEALGVLEKYAVENHLTGITLYEDGNYAMYNPRLKFGASSYVPGYGWGTITEGSITEPLKTQANANWQMYYHDYESADPAKINYMNDKGSIVGGLYGNVASGYWTTRLNSTKDGYEWVNLLAKEKPQAVNPDSVTGLADTYKFEVTQDLEYSNLAKKEDFKAFDGRKVQLEDYLTPYKELHNQSNKLARGADGLSSGSAIKGMDAYYEATSAGYDQQAWDNVGLKATEENGKWYLTVTFNAPQNSFYAMYYMASSLYAPIPKSFVELCGGMASVGTGGDNGVTIMDTTLSTGQFVVEEWKNGVEIVFKKNPRYVDKAPGKYNIEGIHVAIMSSLTTDPDAALNAFLADKVDACGVPSSKMEQYKGDPRAQKVVGSSTTRLTVNSCTQEEWEYYFGTNGIVTKTPTEEYWDVEPAMSNNDFVNAISYAIDRQTMAANRGAGPSCSFFADTYLSNPEQGLSYNKTSYHKEAISSLTEGTDGYGYSLTFAKASFQKAVTDLIASGAYNKGDTITLDIVWQSQSNVTTIGNELKSYINKAWEGITDLKLEINDIVPAIWEDAYYKHMLVGQYDIALGGINGTSLNPLQFFRNMISSNPNNFTLNYGANTALNTQDIFYAGQYWSFDALYWAFESGVYVNADGTENQKPKDFEGEFNPLVDYRFAISSSNHNKDTNIRTVKLDCALNAGFNLSNVKVTTVVEGETVVLTSSIVNGQVIVTIPESIATSGNSIKIDLTGLVSNGDVTKNVNATFSTVIKLKK